MVGVGDTELLATAPLLPSRTGAPPVGHSPTGCAGVPGEGWAGAQPVSGPVRRKGCTEVPEDDPPADDDYVSAPCRQGYHFACWGELVGCTCPCHRSRTVPEVPTG